MPDNKIYLASQSPRRRELLTQIGIDYKVINSSIDETPLASESPDQYAIRMSEEKARQGWLNCQQIQPVLGADTCIVYNGKILGKPQNKKDGLDILEKLSNGTHEVLSAVTIVGHNPGGNSDYKEKSRLNRSLVTFRDISPQQREWYWASGEPADKAGAYAIQGLAAIFISKIEGSYSGIMGLPLFEVAELLTEFGILDTE